MRIAQLESCIPQLNRFEQARIAQECGHRLQLATRCEARTALLSYIDVTVSAKGGRMSHDDLAVALTLADQADAVTHGPLRRAGPAGRHQTGPDAGHRRRSRRSRPGLRATLCRSDRPDDSVLGEEFGGTTTLTGRQWIIDPIDGTKNFVRGVPVWASLIALLARRRAPGRGRRVRLRCNVVGGPPPARARSWQSAIARPAGSRFPQWRN